MPNFFPYFVLIVISVVLFVVSWRKAANKKLIIFYLCMAGFVYFFEFVVLVLLKCYVYEPGVFKDPYIDNIFGANISDGFIVPLAAVFIAVYNLGSGWIAVIVLCFIGIEELFLYLHVYKHFWWKTIYTGLGLIIQFAIGKWVWDKICFHTKRFIVRFGAIYFSSVTIQATVLYYLTAVFDAVFFKVNWFHEPTRGNIAFEASFAFVNSIFFTLVVVTKARWYWKTILIVFGACLNVLLHKWGILVVQGYWTIALLTLIQAGYLFILKYFREILEEKRE
jgi:hypothetical protein